ncbi:MAG: ribosome maturation factor RimM [Mariprofundales bacterium]
MSNPPPATQKIEIGHISGAHGLQGALRIHSETRPIATIGNYKQWWLGTNRDNLSPFQVERCWSHSHKLLATLENVASRNDADSLRGLRIFIPLNAIDDEEEAFLWHRLIGCSVITTTETILGKVCRIEEYGSSDILVVADRGGEWMIPFTESIIAAVNIESQSITVDLPDGMDACFSPNS